MFDGLLVLPLHVFLQDMQEKIEKICEMAAIMWRAVEIDESNAGREQELISRLQVKFNNIVTQENVGNKLRFLF